MNPLTNADVMNLTNFIYTEMGQRNYDHKFMVGSMVLNRLLAGRPRKFGTTVQEVLKQHHGENSSSLASFAFDEDAYKQSLSIASGLLRGTIAPLKVHYYFTKKGAKNSKVSLKSLKEQDPIGRFKVFTLRRLSVRKPKKEE